MHETLLKILRASAYQCQERSKQETTQREMQMQVVLQMLGLGPRINRKRDGARLDRGVPETYSMMRPNPCQCRLQRRVILEPVTGLLVRHPERVGDPLVRDRCEFLNPHRQCNARMPGRTGQ